MDKIDKLILSTLQEDAKISNIMISEKVGLSPSACHRRLEQLKKSKIINNFSANLNLEKIGYSVLVMVNISLNGQSAIMLHEFESEVKKIPQVLSCFLLSGNNDYLLRVAAQDIKDYEQIHLNFLSLLPHVLRIESIFILREIVNRGLNIQKL